MIPADKPRPGVTSTGRGCWSGASWYKEGNFVPEEGSKVIPFPGTTSTTPDGPEDLEPARFTFKKADRS